MDRPSVCLVSLPFISVTTPGLGVSTLQATLREADIDARVHYGALDYFRFYRSEQRPSAALFEYNFLASNGDLGDVFFSGALWGGSLDPIRETMRRIVDSPNSLFSRSERELLVASIVAKAERAREFLEFCVERADLAGCDIVGFSSTFCQNVASIAMARMVRQRHPDVHIVFGGANCEGPMGRQLLQSFPWIDAVVQGEADHAFPRYVRRFAAGESIDEIPGALWREDGAVCEGARPQPLRDLDALPMPEFADYLEQLPAVLTAPENRAELQLPIETSRGCWWGEKSHCTFCGLNPTMMSFRAKSPDRAVRELRRIRDEYGYRNVCAVDNILSMGYFSDVLPRIEELGLRIFYETKANLKEEHVRGLAAAGVRVIQPGIEGLSSEILALMRKGVKAVQNVALLKWCRTYGVRPIWFFLYRFPHERAEPYWEAITLIPRLVHLPPPQNPNPVVIDRYSPLFQQSEQFGLTNLRPATRVDICYRGLTPEERFELAYHFDADLPDDTAPADYVLPLWNAVLEWQRREAGGARFTVVGGRCVSLLIDERRETQRAYLLTGSAHDAHGWLWQARTRDHLARALATTQGDVPELDAEDVAILLQAHALGAEEIPGPANLHADLDRFLDDLDQRWITAALDGRHISLATSPSEAHVLRDDEHALGQRLVPA